MSTGDVVVLKPPPGSCPGGGGAPTPMDLSVFLEIMLQWTKGTLSKEFTYTGLDLTRISYFDVDGGTELYRVEFSYDGSGFLDTEVATRLADSAAQTKTYTHASGVVTKVVVT